MASPLKCDLCANPATVHLTQIVNNKVHKVDLCESCAQSKGVTDPSGFSLADLLLKASLNPETPTAGIRCEHFSQQPEQSLPHPTIGGLQKILLVYFVIFEAAFSLKILRQNVNAIFL